MPKKKRFAKKFPKEITKNLIFILSGLAIAILISFFIKYNQDNRSRASEDSLGREERRLDFLGNNYTHFKAENCTYQDSSIIMEYHKPGVRELVKQQLNTMLDNEVDSIRIIVWFKHGATGNWGAIPSETGQITPIYKQNLVNFIYDLNQAKFKQLFVAFGPQNENDPRNANEWNPVYLSENISFINSVTNTVVQNKKGLKVYFDLQNEVNLSKGVGVFDKNNIDSQAFISILKQFKEKFPNEQVYFSSLGYMGPVDNMNEKRLDFLFNLYSQASHTPQFMEVHQYGWHNPENEINPKELSQSLELIDDFLNDKGYTDMPILIGETAYANKHIPTVISKFIAGRERKVLGVMQWGMMDKNCKNQLVPLDADFFYDEFRKYSLSPYYYPRPTVIPISSNEILKYQNLRTGSRDQLENKVYKKDSITTRIVNGFVIDPDKKTQEVQLVFYLDGSNKEGGTFAGTMKTNYPLLGLNDKYNTTGIHGFRYIIADKYLDGKKHTLHIYGLKQVSSESKHLPVPTLELKLIPLKDSPVSFTLQ